MQNTNETQNPEPIVEPTPIPASAPAAPASNGEYVYFQKVIASMPFYVNRVPVAFEPLARNMGVLKLSANDPLVPALTASAKANRGGIVMIDGAVYEELKKKLPFNPLAQKSRQHVLQALPSPGAPRSKNTVVANVAADNPNRISGKGNGVAPVGGRGTGERAGTLSPAPVPQSDTVAEFQPATGKKNFKMPVIKKTDSRSLSGGVEEIDPTD